VDHPGGGGVGVEDLDILRWSSPRGLNLGAMLFRVQIVSLRHAFGCLHSIVQYVVQV